MAVRNFDAIKRQGDMIAEQQANKRRMVEENFWKRVDIIKNSHADAIDFIDTIDAMCKNSMRAMVDEWLKNKNVHYTIYNKKFGVCCLSDSRQSAHVYYCPQENGIDTVEFGWSGWGMCECYSTNKSTDYLIHVALKRDRNYDEGLTMMAERLQPFIDAFFKWVETI